MEMMKIMFLHDHDLMNQHGGSFIAMTDKGFLPWFYKSVWGLQKNINQKTELVQEYFHKTAWNVEIHEQDPYRNVLKMTHRCLFFFCLALKKHH